MDLKIAAIAFGTAPCAIALVNQAVLLTQNSSDFGNTQV
jgi:hypothetical protein